MHDENACKREAIFFYQKISKIGYDFDFLEVSAVYQIAEMLNLATKLYTFNHSNSVKAKITKKNLYV